jgi:hypothetical protein
MTSSEAPKEPVPEFEDEPAGYQRAQEETAP